MKVLLWFLSVYVLLLAGLPCPDSDCCLNHQSLSHASHESGHTPPTSNAPAPDDHQAPCSPFCHCATCPGFTLTVPVFLRVISLPLSSPARSQLISRYVMSFSALHLLTVWQPPRR